MSMGHCSEQRTGFEVTKDWNGADQFAIRSPRGASVRVCLHGGQVVSWRNHRGEELLFSSSKAIFKPPRATRGGVDQLQRPPGSPGQAVERWVGGFVRP
ncbi:Galactose mutarotase-like superfamily protein [Zea mays]|uniref:Galactose mutarotase-like superfamily protein n=1 Tax=Zea mays TaxID=4577 RepID=A0A1D6NGV7_MAIZE|nr:Galactose mutarotase-like superfamily protein [Zea mays]